MSSARFLLVYKIALCYSAASLNSLDAFNNVVLDF
ncbi:uncharacterized protein METZ01_LOCUS145701, partial [marine metagenome]